MRAAAGVAAGVLKTTCTFKRHVLQGVRGDSCSHSGY